MAPRLIGLATPHVEGARRRGSKITCERCSRCGTGRRWRSRDAVGRWLMTRWRCKMQQLSERMVAKQRWGHARLLRVSASWANADTSKGIVTAKMAGRAS